MRRSSRCCSGRPNNTPGAYHSGFTADLRQLIQTTDQHAQVIVIGFSLGGNITLKCAGEGGLPDRVKAMIGVSVPIHLASSSKELGRWHNWVYIARFLRQLKRKALAKAERFPKVGLDPFAIRASRTFQDFDDAYTAPVHGFKDAADYYERSSARRFLASIEVPSLLINALNDSFLGAECYVDPGVQVSPQLRVLTPAFGGHVGFANDVLMRREFWHEQQVMEFIQTFAP